MLAPEFSRQLATAVQLPPINRWAPDQRARLAKAAQGTTSVDGLPDDLRNAVHQALEAEPFIAAGGAMVVAPAAEVRQFHLPGRHDQKRHGRRAGPKTVDPSDVLEGADVLDAVPSAWTAPEDDPSMDGFHLYQAGRLMNRRLRAGAGDMGEFHPKLRDGVEDVDRGFDKAPPITRPVRATRGIHRGTEIFGPVGAAKGKTFVDHGFVSTTANPFISRAFAAGTDDGAVLRIIVPSGSKVLKMSEMDYEAELLLPRGTSFRVVDDRPEDGVRVIDVEVVP